jgi:hypothetical protein
MKYLPQLIAGAAIGAALVSAFPTSQAAPPTTARPGAAIPLRVALPPLYAKATPAKRMHLEVPTDGGDGPGTPSNPPPAVAFTIDGIGYLPLAVTTMDGVDWYVQCARFADGVTSCARVVEASRMRGLQISTALANDGEHPIVFFTQTAVPDTAQEADRQSLMTGVFTQLHQQAMTDLRTASTAPRSRTARPGRRKAECDASAGSCGSDDPDPGGGIPTIEVPGTPDWSPIPIFTPYVPFPPPSDPVPTPPDPAGPPDTGTRELSAPNKACIALVGPGGMPAMACVEVSGKRPDPMIPPEAIPLPPPGWDWCAHGGICNATPTLPPDWRDKICASKMTVDITNCEQDFNRGKISFDKLQQCWDTKMADYAKCRAQVGKLTAPVTH